MDESEIIKAAKAVGLNPYDMKASPRDAINSLQHFAALVAAKERERLFGKAQRDGEMRLILHRWEDGRCFAAAEHFSAEQTHCGPDDLLQMAVGRLDDSLDAGIAAAIRARGQKEGA
jgi:hypothetical protein